MNLGLSGRLTAATIASPLTPLLLIAAIAMGMLALVSIPREEEPQISVPMVDVMVRADRLSRLRAIRLHGAIVQVLQRALALGGSTLRDFSSADGQSGYFQMDAMVYGREGLPCRACGTPIRQLRQGQRSTFFCPQCQKP